MFFKASAECDMEGNFLLRMVTKNAAHFKNVFELKARVMTWLPTFFGVLFELTF